MQALWAIQWAYSSVYVSVMLNFHLYTRFTQGKYRENTKVNEMRAYYPC